MAARWRLPSRVRGGLCACPGAAHRVPVCGTVCARACVEGPPGVYLRMRWAIVVPLRRAGRGPAPAQSLLRGDVFQNSLPAVTGSAAAGVGGGSAAPIGLQRPGDCRQTPGGGRERAPGEVQRLARRAKMGRLRQMDGEREGARQAEMGRRVVRQTAKGRAAERTESLERRETEA